MLLFVHHRDILKLNVQVLIHGMEGATDRHVILQLHDDLLPNKGLEKGVEQLEVA